MFFVMVWAATPVLISTDQYDHLLQIIAEGFENIEHSADKVHTRLAAIDASIQYLDDHMHNGFDHANKQLQYLQKRDRYSLEELCQGQEMEIEGLRRLLLQSRRSKARLEELIKRFKEKYDQFATASETSVQLNSA